MVQKHCCKSASTNALLVLRVEWEFWTSSNDACGSSCDRQSRFKLDFAETAIDLEKVKLFETLTHKLCSNHVDTLLPKAVQCSIAMTHKQYTLYFCSPLSLSCLFICSVATHNSSPISWYRSAWTALTVRRAKTIVSTVDATVQWTVFHKAYKAATMAVRYIWLIAELVTQCACCSDS